MLKILSLIGLLLAPQARADAPVIWSGTTAKWLPNGLHSAGLCKLDAAGVQTNYTTDGIVKMSSGVPGAAASGTDYAPATSGSAILKGNGAGGFSSASSGTDYEVPLTFSGGVTRSTNNIACDTANGSTKGCVTAADWTTFNNKFTLPSLTLGSILFSDGSTIAQDNSKFFYDATNHRVGIGTTTPESRLAIHPTADNYNEFLTLWGTSAGNYYTFYVSPGGSFSIINLFQGIGIGGAIPTGEWGLANGTAALGSALTVKGFYTTDVGLVITKFPSQSVNMQEWRDTDNSTVMAKVDQNGAGFFSGLSDTALGTGIAHFNSSGLLSSSAVDLSGSEATGTLAAARMPALTSDVTSSAGSTATTVAKIQGTTVSGTTGSGNVVFSTSPTLTTPALGTPSALVLTNATGLPIAGGGTGASTKAGAFDALSPMTSSGDIIYGGSSGTGTRLAKGSDGQVLTLASGVPSWATPSAGSGTYSMLGAATFALTASCTWTRNSTTFSDFNTTSACPAPTVTTVDSTNGSIQNTDSDLPQVTVNSMAAGTYKVTAIFTGHNSSGGVRFSYRISDGTTNGPSVAGSSDDFNSFNTSWLFTYGSSGNHTFKIQGKNNSGTVNIDNTDGPEAELTFIFERVF